MDKKIIIKHIEEMYSFKDKLYNENIFQLKDYPHIFKIEVTNYNLIAKIIKKSKIYCTNINKLYHDLSTIEYIEIPMLTNDKKYGVSDKDEIMLLYEELQNIKVNPGPIWWSDCLGSIHAIKYENYYKHYLPFDYYEQTIRLFALAEKFIPNDKKSKIYSLLAKVNIDKLNKKLCFKICHNDPYNLNIMQSVDEFKLIDTDGIGLSPKEYDIQRLLYNNVINFNCIEDVMNFWEIFKNNYEYKTSDSIDIELLKNIYILDFIRTISWLYIVSNDFSRVDRLRQKEQLNLFEKSLDNDSHCKILRNI